MDEIKEEWREWNKGRMEEIMDEIMEEWKK